MLNRWQPFSGNKSLVFAKSALTTTVVTTVVWLTVTLLTKPEPDEVLTAFYRRVRPDVRGWKRIAALAPDVRSTATSAAILEAGRWGASWFMPASSERENCCCMQTAAGAMLLACSVISGVALYRVVIRNFKMEPDEPETLTAQKSV